MAAIDWGKQIVEIISSLSNLAGQVYCKTIDISITLEMVWELCVRWGGGSGAVCLVRGSGWSRPFVEPNTRERLIKPDAPAPRHSPRNGGWRDSISNLR